MQHHAAEALGQQAGVALGVVRPPARRARRPRGSGGAIGPSSSRAESSSCSVRNRPVVTPAVGDTTTAAMSSESTFASAATRSIRPARGRVVADLREQLGEALAPEHALGACGPRSARR